MLSRLAVGVRVDGDDETLERARAERRPGGDTPQGASLRALRVQLEIEENKRIRRGIGGEKEGDIGASTGELEAGRRSVTLAEMTSTRERARPAVA